MSVYAAEREVADELVTIPARVTGTSEVKLGDEALEDAAIGDSDVTVGDGGDFDEDGGSCLIGGVVCDYDSVTYIGDAADEGDPAVLHLTAPLTTAVTAGDRVDVWDPLGNNGSGEVAVTYTATLASDAPDIAGDPLEASVDREVVVQLAEGIRSQGSEVVDLVRDGDDLRVVGLRSRVPAIQSQNIEAIRSSGYLLTDALIADSAVTTVAWFDYAASGGITYDATTKRFRVPADGEYDITAVVCWASNGTGSRAVQVLYDTYFGTLPDAENRVQAVTGSRTVHECSRTRALKAGEFIYVQVQQTSGASLNLLHDDTKVTIHRRPGA